ncbi:MAG: sigma-70 family RNA polymerase sigma factor [Deltaproteobacteria bacterium]|nr:sigma-70 family RNA polymerase sigma factor [Deltaproteobacteria bacterium]
MKRDQLEALLKEHAQAILSLCHQVAGPADARDAAQESLARIVAGVGSFDSAKGSFRGWALTVARNVCRDRLRRRGLERAAFDARATPDGEVVAADGAPDPERVALARIDAQALGEALATLPEPMRAALVLFHVHEATYEEIAAALGVPIGTVMTWLHRGRKRLREAFAARGAS